MVSLTEPHFYIKYREIIDFRNQRSAWGKHGIANPLQVGPWLYQLVIGFSEEERKDQLAFFIKEFDRSNSWRSGRGKELRITVQAHIVALPPYEWIKTHMVEIEQDILSQQKNLEFYQREALMARLSQED